jgi:methyl-accepting chemotaxis protein
MKLNTKFSLIAAWGVFQFILLALCAVQGSWLMVSLKNYQYVQATLQYDLSDTSNFLNSVDYWSVDSSEVQAEWYAKRNALDTDFERLKGKNVAWVLPGDLRNSIDEFEKQWTLIRPQFSLLDPAFSSMQNLKLSKEIKAKVAKDGIRQAALMYPESPELRDMMVQLSDVHMQMKPILTAEKTLSRLSSRIADSLALFVEHARIVYMIITIVVCVFSAVVLYLFMHFTTSKITHRIRLLQDMSSKLAKKDFTVEVSPSGSTEIRGLMENMNKMVTQLNDFFIIVKKSASRAISSGYSINDSANSTAAATQEINANIESITKEFEQINESVERAAQSIALIDREVDVLVSDNNAQTQAIEASDAAVSDMAKTIGQISEKASERAKSAEEMKSLVADGDEKISATNTLLGQITSQLDEIGEIVTIINAVAEQTNLLSMNAAIESAHAGEAGKGFAVVAEEIRSLAESTAENAKKINDSISKIVQNATAANSSSTAASEAFRKVSDHSAQMLESLREITEGVGKLDERTHEITSKASQTASTADKIDGYCRNLSVQQKNISNEMKSMTGLFSEAVSGIREIKTGTEDIVKRMSAVGEQSTESYRNMTELENILDEFRTKSDADEQTAIPADAHITEIISPELKAAIEAEPPAGKGDDIDFDPSAVEEYRPE